MAKLQTGVPAPEHTIGQYTFLEKTKNKELTEFKDGYLVKLRRQVKEDGFKRRFNVAYVDADGKSHTLMKWDNMGNASTPDKIINMLLQGKATLRKDGSGKVTSSITPKQVKVIAKTSIEELLK